MEYDLSSFYDLVVVFALVLASGLFVAAEFALVRSNPSHFKSADGRRRIGSQTALRLIEDMDLTLSSIQLGITLSGVCLGWFGVRTITALFLLLIGSFGTIEYPLLVSVVVTVLSLALIVYFQVVFGELIAKSVALRHSTGTLRALSGMIFIFSQVCRPIIFLLHRSAELTLRAVGISRTTEANRAHSLAELSFLVSKSTEGGLLDKDEEQMLRGVFGLSDTVAREVMTPRTDLVAIAADATIEEVINTIRDSGLSRFPVKGESIDDVVGILLARDLLSFVVPSFLRSGVRKEDFSVRKLMREAYFVPGTKPIDDLLGEFKRRKLHLAIVLDEHGGVDGVVTLEDLIEEIVGDIFDESDFPEKSIVVQDNGDVLIDGGQLVADLNTRFALEIPEGAYDTIAGFIFTSLGRMPRPGDSIVVNRVDNPIAAQETDAEPAAELPVEDGAADGSESARAEKEEDVHPKALITVEKVQSYRIETVRLRPSYIPEVSESPSPVGTSNSLESASDHEV
ncbi:MAG: hemolysin family protein [Bdellovibrionota bacterium]